MADPSLNFSPLSTNFGSILAGNSVAYQSYHIKNAAGTQTAKNMSIYLVKSVTGKSEFIVESWLRFSTAAETTRVGGSVSGGAWCQAPSIVAAASIWVKHRVIIPSDASSSGSQPFFGKHKYQFT